MKIEIKTYRVGEDERLDLSKRPTAVDPLYASNEAYHAALSAHVAFLQRHQERLYAAGREALLIVLQGMDTSGKDSAIAHVMSGVNPQGCRVASFKTPTPAEQRHDFLWRASRELPERGEIVVFNRSYYEDLLIQRVHPKLLTLGGLQPPKHLDKLWAERDHSVRQFERHLVANATHIVKVFLHISKAEQKRRLLARVDDEEKNWKASLTDVVERGYWKDYQRAYEDAMSQTSVKSAPWYVVPADDKKNARLIVSQIVVEALSKLSAEAPPADEARKQELREIRERLQRE